VALLGRPSAKEGVSCRFKSNRGEIWHDSSLNKCASIDGVITHIFDLLTHFQGVDHVVISHIKVLLSGDNMQQRLQAVYLARYSSHSVYSS